MIKKLLCLIRHPTTVSLVGLLCVLATVWFVAPLLGIGKAPTRYPLEGIGVRLVLITLIVTLWFARRIWAGFKAYRTNAQMLKSIAESEQAKQVNESQLAAKEQVAELRHRMQDALAILKRAKLGNALGAQYAYQLPWYVIIGAPGSGKTTALVNSGIRFPLGERLGSGAVKGVGGTRNCDWWFTDEAVLLDTAGRYTTQDSHAEVDAAAWKGFLDLLKRYRKRRPINGVLVAVSVADLMQQTSKQRQEHAAQLKRRIQELHAHFGIRFPVYVMFTKCDLLAGFNDFFGSLSREERDQVWGMTFPLEDTNTIADMMPTYGANYDALERRLNERVIERVHAGRDMARRAALYEFPLQFGAFKEISERFLNEVFQVTKFEERVMLRGVYFTSGTQEGTPIDRLMGAIAKTFSVENTVMSVPVGAGKSYFVTRMLRDLVFREAGLAGTNLKLERQRRWLQHGAYAAAIALTVLTSVAWVASYQISVDHLRTVADGARQIKHTLGALNVRESKITALLPVLDGARAIPGGYGANHGNTPSWLGLGARQGNAVSAEASEAYQRTLAGVLLPTIARRLEQQIRDDGADLSFLFEALRVYLMLAEPKRFDAKAIAAWLEFDWEHPSASITPAQRQRLMSHAHAMLERGIPSPAITQDRGLIEQARRSLSAMSSAQRVYRQLKQLPDVRALPEYRLSDVSGREGALVFARKSGASWGKGIPGLFTFDGYHGTVKDKINLAAQDISEDSWVLGQFATSTDKDRHKISDEVRQLYLAEYQREWDRVLSDITVIPFSDMNRAALVLNVLSNPSDSPLRRLLQAVVRETQLHTVSAKINDASTPNAVGLLDAAKAKISERLSHLAGTQVNLDVATNTADAPEKAVNQHFARLHQYVQGGGGKEGGAPLDRTMTLLNDLNVYLAAAMSAIQSGQRPPPPTPQNAQTLQQISQEAPRSPAPVSGMMTRVADGTRAIVVGGSLLNADWRSSVLPMCKEGITSRYPFARQAGQDVTREDFATFFSAGGTVDTFFQRSLKDFVDTHRDPWQTRSFDGARLHISSAALNSLRDAASIREVFFRGGGQTMSLSVELKPVAMDANLTRFSLDIDGQVLRYDHGPQIAVPIRWPGPRGSGQVSLEYEPPSAGGRKAMSFDGPWALFRLFDKARMQPTKDPARFEMTFDLDGRTVTLELRASSIANPFRLASLERFQCPERL